VSDLEAMATALLKLVRRCERSAPGESCSIIAALSAARHKESILKLMAAFR